MIVAAVIMLFGAFRHGVSVTDATWQAKWAARDTRDAAALAENESAQRVLEHTRQLSMNKAIQDGQRTLDQATVDAATARAAADSLRGEVGQLAARLATRQAGDNSCTAATSAAATRAVMVLADLFKRADERAGDLAGYAQDSHARGVTCERAFDGISRGNVQ